MLSNSDFREWILKNVKHYNKECGEWKSHMLITHCNPWSFYLKFASSLKSITVELEVDNIGDEWIMLVRTHLDGSVYLSIETLLQKFNSRNCYIFCSVDKNN